MVEKKIISLLDSQLVERCVDVIGRGELVIFPTETIYGIGGNAADDRAWEKLRKLKRDRTKPFTYLVANWEMAEGLIGGDTAGIQVIAERLWPGPVTLVVRSGDDVAARFRNPDGSLGLRMPGIDRIRDAIDACGVPWVHTSANLPGGKGARKIRKIDEDVLDSASLVIDGRTTALGGESTILDTRYRPYKILRSGVMTERRIMDVLDFHISM